MSLQDSRGETFTATVESARLRLSGLGELYRAHHLGVNDVLMITPRPDGTYGVECVVKPHARPAAVPERPAPAPATIEKRVVIHATPHVREVRMERVSAESAASQLPALRIQASRPGTRSEAQRPLETQKPLETQESSSPPEASIRVQEVTVQEVAVQQVAVQKASVVALSPKTTQLKTVQHSEAGGQGSASAASPAPTPSSQPEAVNVLPSGAGQSAPGPVSVGTPAAPTGLASAALAVATPSAPVSASTQGVTVRPPALPVASVQTESPASRPSADAGQHRAAQTDPVPARDPAAAQRQPPGPQVEGQLADLAKLTGYGFEHLGVGVVRLRASLGSQSYSVLIATTPAALTSPAWSEPCDYMALLTTEDQRPQGIPRFTHAALAALLEHARLAPLTPVDLRGYWNTGSFDQQSVESVAELVSAHLAQRGVFSHVLLTLAQQPAHSLVQATRLAERLGSGVNTAELQSMLETLSRPPFMALTPLPGGQYYLRSEVRDLLGEVGDYAEGMRRRLRPAAAAD
ncbi:hypothetical protein [Deinococcus sp.]|uniref:hypothetical protein n=1 Tax=Deinococcus sp. TaxID=47478 RepID=UPI003CC6C649